MLAQVVARAECFGAACIADSCRHSKTQSDFDRCVNDSKVYVLSYTAIQSAGLGCFQ